MRVFPGRTWFLSLESTTKLCLTKKANQLYQQKISNKHKLKDYKMAADF